MVFLGTYKHNIDDKNRLALPTKLASVFVDHIAIISKGFEGCLEVRTKIDFSKRSEEILAFSQNKKDARILARQILANSHEVEIDKNNRVLLPTNLKELANLKKNVIIIGVGNKIEIWDEKAYENFQKLTNNQFEKIAEGIEDHDK